MKRLDASGAPRWTLLLIMVLTVVLALLAPSARASSALAAVSPSADGTAFGTLVTSPDHAQDEARDGLRAAMLELSWKAYEPSQGVFDASYAARVKAQAQALRAAGMQVTLGLGLHYTPAWVLAEPNSRYVDQHGNTSSEANLVFNATLRSQADAYLKRVDADLGLQNFWAVRITSGGSSELLYPGNGSYWAFDANAQGGSARPSTLPADPAPGWKPGTPAAGSAAVASWEDWYVGALADVARWQMDQLHTLGFHGYYQLVTPGSGSRPSATAQAVASGLPDGLVGIGAAWDQLYAHFAGRSDVTAYISSVADGSGGDDTCEPGDSSVALTSPAAGGWSATRWISRIAAVDGLTVAGENPGYGQPASENSRYVDTSSSGMMAHALSQAAACAFLAFYWAHDSQLFDGTVPYQTYLMSIRRVATLGVSAPRPSSSGAATPTSTSNATPTSTPRPTSTSTPVSSATSRPVATTSPTSGSAAPVTVVPTSASATSPSGSSPSTQEPTQGASSAPEPLPSSAPTPLPTSLPTATPTAPAAAGPGFLEQLRVALCRLYHHHHHRSCRYHQAG